MCAYRAPYSIRKMRTYRIVGIQSTSISHLTPTITNKVKRRNAFIEKGAQAVLGFNGNVNTAQAKQFEFTFWSCLRTDYSYAESGDEFADIDEIWTGNHTIQQAFNKAKQMNSSIEASFQAVLDGDGCNAYLTTD